MNARARSTFVRDGKRLTADPSTVTTFARLAAGRVAA
jgi:hypothetical protein